MLQGYLISSLATTQRSMKVVLLASLRRGLGRVCLRQVGGRETEPGPIEDIVRAVAYDF